MNTMNVIGALKEVKDSENRVALTPAGVKVLVEEGQVVYVQKDAGKNTGFSDDEYEEAGAEILDTAEDVVKTVDILVKVKEPVPEEYHLLDKFAGKTLFTYLHLSGVDKGLTLKLMEKHITAIAYETVEDAEGRLPLLAPMSEVAGVLAAQYGSQYLQKKYHGRGVTMGAIHGSVPCETVVLGAGIVGSAVARTAAGMGGKVTVLNRGEERLNEFSKEAKSYLGPKLFRNMRFELLEEDDNLSDAVKNADLLVGAILIPGGRAPQIVSKKMVKGMKKGSVIVDVAIDQGGCVWGSRPTTHSNPIYSLEDKVYCCITNMPGQVALQSTQALTHATLPYLLMMANRGVKNAIRDSLSSSSPDKGGFAKGVNVYKGKITYENVARDLLLEDKYVELKELI